MHDILTALNAVGVEPSLVKGAVSLLTGVPSWRTQRDIDFHILEHEVATTREVLERLGYKTLKKMSDRHQHIDSMVRPDPDVAVEPLAHKWSKGSACFKCIDNGKCCNERFN